MFAEDVRRATPAPAACSQWIRQDAARNPRESHSVGPEQNRVSGQLRELHPKVGELQAQAHAFVWLALAEGAGSAHCVVFQQTGGSAGQYLPPLRFV